MDELRKVVHRSARRREQVIDTDYYTMPPPGMFVGEHTGFVVADPGLMSVLLDVADAAEPVCSAKVMGGTHYQEHGYCGECNRSWPCEVARLRATLDRLQGVRRG